MRLSVGRLAADVLGDLVELVGGHVQPVPRLAALGATRTRSPGTRGSPPRTRADGALHQLDEPPDAVLLVHDEVARAQLQRVDDVAPPARHAAHVARARNPHGP